MDQARTVLITGGAIGIGRGTALAFARTGHHVVITDILENEGQELVAAIHAEGGSASFHALDVRSTTRTDEVVQAVIEATGTCQRS